MSDTLRVSNLHFGNAASNYNQPQMGFTSVGIGSTANYGFLQFFGTSNTLCWTANGTVGIGTTAPRNALDVNGSLSIGNRVLGTPDSSPNGTFWLGLNGTGTEAERLAIGIAGNQTSGIVNTIELNKNTNVLGNFIKKGTTDGYDIRISGGTATNSGYVDFFADSVSRGYIGNASLIDLDIVAQNGTKLNFYTAGTRRLLIDTNGNVGIGTAAPASALHVVGSNSLSTPAVVSFVNNGGGQNGTGSDIVNSQITMGAFGPYIRSVQQNTAYTDGIRLDLCTNLGSNDSTPIPRISILAGLYGGFVGIGTTSINYTLQIGTTGSILRIGGLTNAGSSANTSTYGLERSRNQIQFSGYRDALTDKVGAKIVGINKQTYANTTVRHVIQSTDLAFFTVPPDTNDLDNTVERMRITDTGNVGIGVTNPGAILQINDNSIAASSFPLSIFTPNLPVGGEQYILFGTASSTANQVQFGFRNVAAGSNLNFSFIQNFGVGYAMCWRANGFVGIGITNPSAPLHVVGSATINTTSTSWMTKGSGGIATSGGSTFTTVSIYAAGSIWAGDVIGCATVTSFSDQRIKKNIQPINEVFDLIQKIEIVSYKHIDQRKKAVKYGVVAQQIQPFLPEVIDKTKNWIPVPFILSTSHECHENQVTIIVDASSPELQIGRKIKLYVQYDTTETEYETELISITSTSITCKVWDAYHATDRVFVYGVELDDFLVVDKQQLGLLALAGVQELHKTISIHETTILSLQAQNTSLRARMDALEARLNA